MNSQPLAFMGFSSLITQHCIWCPVSCRGSRETPSPWAWPPLCVPLSELLVARLHMLLTLKSSHRVSSPSLSFAKHTLVLSLGKYFSVICIKLQYQELCWQALMKCWENSPYYIKSGYFDCQHQCLISNGCFSSFCWDKLSQTLIGAPFSLFFPFCFPLSLLGLNQTRSLVCSF